MAVPDCYKTAAQATALGSEVVTSPRDVPGIGRFGTAVDTTGAAVAYITLTNR